MAPPRIIALYFAAISYAITIAASLNMLNRSS